MSIDIDKYLTAQNPPRPLELFPEGVLNEMLNGFCLYLKAGVAILYHKDGLNSIKDIAEGESHFDRIETDEVRQAFNKFCYEFRKNHDKLCCNFDSKKAIEFWMNPNKGPEKYECHMGLFDMAYPLKIGNQTVAVLFAGQIMTHTQIQKIKQNVNLKAIVGYQYELNTLIDNIDKSLHHIENDIDSTFVQFKKFGQMLQDLLSRLYEQHNNATRRQFLGEVSRELTLFRTDHLNEWLNILNYVLSQFLQLTNLESIKIFSRKKSRFELWGVYPEQQIINKEERKPIPVKLIALLPNSRFIPMETLRSLIIQSGDFQNLQKILDFPKDNVTLFLYEYQDNSNLFLDTLVAFSGQMKEADNNFIKDFCETIALRVQVTRLIFTLREERSKFAERVGHVGHTTKTPLQKVIIQLDELKTKNIFSIKGAEEAYRIIEDCKRSIRLAKLYMQNIYNEPISNKGQRVRLRQILDESISQIREIAKERQCELIITIENYIDPKTHDQGNLHIAFTNLLDNATKYSNPGGCIKISLSEYCEDIGLLKVENKGQGIPESYLEKVKRGRWRWSAPNISEDLKLRRQGSGLGLAMASMYIEDHGGWLEVQSYPNFPEYRNDASDNWTTTVYVGLPIEK